MDEANKDKLKLALTVIELVENVNKNKIIKN